MLGINSANLDFGTWSTGEEHSADRRSMTKNGRNGASSWCPPTGMSHENHLSTAMVLTRPVEYPYILGVGGFIPNQSFDVLPSPLRSTYKLPGMISTAKLYIRL